MPQAAAQTSVLDRIFQKFQSKRQSGIQNNQQEPAEIDDPANPGKKIKNPKFQTNDNNNNDNNNDPMSLYKGLFDAPSGENQKQAPKLALSREKIAEAAGKMNFMDGMPKELTDALAVDGGLNIENISALINHAGRSAYSKALEHSTHLTGSFVEMRSAHDNEQLPAHIRKYSAQSRSRTGPDGANIDDPAVREHLDMISERIASKFPDASEDEVRDMTHEYFGTVYRKVNPTAFQNQQSGGPRNSDTEEFDHDSYLQGSKNLQQAAQPAQGKTS